MSEPANTQDTATPHVETTLPEQPLAATEPKTSPNREFLSKLLNKTMRVKITDGRTLIGTFLCTDKNANIVLGSALEFVNFDAASTSPGNALPQITK